MVNIENVLNIEHGILDRHYYRYFYAISHAIKLTYLLWVGIIPY